MECPLWGIIKLWLNLIEFQILKAINLSVWLFSALTMGMLSKQFLSCSLYTNGGRGGFFFHMENPAFVLVQLLAFWLYQDKLQRHNINNPEWVYYGPDICSLLIGNFFFHMWAHVFIQHGGLNTTNTILDIRQKQNKVNPRWSLTSGRGWRHDQIHSKDANRIAMVDGWTDRWQTDRATTVYKENYKGTHSQGERKNKRGKRMVFWGGSAKL